MNRVASNWIDGKWTSSETVGNSINPADGSLVGQFYDADADDAAAAIAAARRAFDETTWPTDRMLRARALLEIAEQYAAHADELAGLVTQEVGYPLRISAFAGSGAAESLRYYAGIARSDAGTAAEVAPGVFFSTLAEPAGVAAIIVPWNGSVGLLIRSLAPALAAGCTAVVKMPGQTAISNELMSQFFAAARSLPPGVVNFFTGSGSEGASLLVTSPDVDVVSYTGSTTVGRIIAANAAATLKRVGFELGGKTPMVVFDDANLDATLPVLCQAVTMLAGQFCMTGSRVLVQRRVADAVRERLSQSLEGVRVGRGDDPDTEMGPLIDKANVERVDRIVEDARAYSKTLVRGGPILDGPLASGSFYRPALLEVEDVTVPLVQNEVFGPVATFEVFDTEDEAVAKANATEFGLAAAVFTRDVDRARRVSRRIKAGTVWTNTWMAVDDRFEEGGFKQSGLGRLRGTHGLADFQELKTYVQVASGA